MVKEHAVEVRLPVSSDLTFVTCYDRLGKLFNHSVSIPIN